MGFLIDTASAGDADFYFQFPPGKCINVGIYLLVSNTVLFRFLNGFLYLVKRAIPHNQ